MIRAVVAASAALLLGSCTLTSQVPLFERSDVPDPSIMGGYQPYRWVDRLEVSKVPKAHRSDCIDPGYTSVVPDGERKSAVQPIYCSYNPDEKRVAAQVQVERTGTAVSFNSPESKVPAQLLQLEAGLYFAQIRNEAGGYDFLLLRLKPSALEFFAVPCDEFPNLVRPAAFGTSSCEAPSLASARAGLERLVAKLDAGLLAPVFIFKRIR